MIQALDPSKNHHWLMQWMDLEDPIPSGEDFILPTLVFVTDDKGIPLAPPEILEELDQERIENFLAGMIERLGAPEKILIGESEEWNLRAWREFSEDLKVSVDFTPFAARSVAELNMVSLHVAGNSQKSSLEIPSESRAKIAQGLLTTALRVRSESKKLTLLRKVLDYDPDCADARIELADASFRASDWRSASEAFQHLIATEQRRWAGSNVLWWDQVASRPYLRAVFGCAMTHWHQSQFLDAARMLEDLLRMNPRDHQGARFLVPLAFLLAEDMESAAASYHDYDEHYPNDYPEPAFIFGRGLMASYFDRDTEAIHTFSEGILKNIYIAPMLLETAIPPEAVWQPNDRSDSSFARDFVASYAMLWDRVPSARRNLREAWTSCTEQVARIVAHRRNLFDIQDQRYDPDYKATWQKLVQADEALSAMPASPAE